MSLKTLTEQKAQAVTQMREILDTIEAENRAMNAEERGAVESIEAELTTIEDQINLRKRTNDLGTDVEAYRTLEHKVASNGNDERSESDRRNSALKAWACRGVANVSEQGVNDAREFGYADMRNISMGLKNSAELRAMSSQTGAAGGYLVDSSFVTQLELAMLAFGGMREVSEVIRTANGEPLAFPTGNDTSNVGAYIAESAARTSPTDPSFDVHTFNAHTITSQIIQVPVELLQDSAFDLEGLLARMSAERIARKSNTAFTTGDGAGEPLGLTLSATLGVTAAGTATITTDELLDLLYSVDPSYRQDAFWMMEDATLKALRKLKDGDGQYIWTPGMLAGEPDTLFGHSVVVNQDMASLATGNITVLFGARGKYKIREVANISVQRLVERYADLGQVGFITTMRNDGALIDAGTNPVKRLIQA